MTRPYRPRVVRQGDHLEKLAFLAGADPEEVWNHPDNAELKAKRVSMQVLHPGDVVHLPEGPPEGMAFSKGSSNRYQAPIPRKKITVALATSDGPIAGQPYEVQGLPRREGEPPPSGTTGPNGEVELMLPVTIREVSVFLPEQNIVHVLSVGDMDPITEASGVRKRLENLGLLHADGDLAEGELESAVGAFQARSGLPVTGVLDDATKGKLVEATGQSG